ncbi:MAG: DUF711 family protein, partial [Clostridia bacterium]|nr:DUF711 family protein [Clostridia bacterium]
MSIPFSNEEILETIQMIQSLHLDVRAVTLGVSLRGCGHPSAAETAHRVYERVVRRAEGLVAACRAVEARVGIPITHCRVAVTPIALLSDGFTARECVELARVLERAADAVGVHYIGGFGALVAKGTTAGDRALLEALPEAIGATERVCAAVEVATTRAGINVEAVLAMG